MKESYREGVASHSGPEPCEGGGNVALEALYREVTFCFGILPWTVALPKGGNLLFRHTALDGGFAQGVSVGWVLSSEIRGFGELTASARTEGNNAPSR